MNEGTDEFKAWKAERKTAAGACTVDTLAEFVRVTMGAEHDYGTVCHAVALCAEAAAWAANACPRGGITGFQAGAVFWEFARSWRGLKGAARLIDYDDALYPQCADRFDRTISRRVLTDLAAKATDKLANDGDNAHPDVVAHWKMLADGGVPFGLTVVDR